MNCMYRIHSPPYLEAQRTRASNWTATTSPICKRSGNRRTHLTVNRVSTMTSPWGVLVVDRGQACVVVVECSIDFGVVVVTLSSPTAHQPHCHLRASCVDLMRAGTDKFEQIRLQKHGQRNASETPAFFDISCFPCVVSGRVFIPFFSIISKKQNKE